MTEEAFERFDRDALAGYVRLLTESGAPALTAAKKTEPRFIVRIAEGTEEIVVWTKDGNKETVEHPEKGDMIVTKGNADGTPALDGYGHNNTWCMRPDAFKAFYDADHPDSATGMYCARPVERRFIQIDRNIEFDAPWGETQRIRAGGFLNISDPNDIYGVARDEFNETYDVGV